MEKWTELQFTMPSEFEAIVEKYTKNDEAHNLEHIREVIKSAQIICDKMDYKYNRIIELACLMHDMGTNLNNRENHHIYAKERFFELYDLKKICVKIQDAINIANCILEHRSSISDEERTSIESKIVAMADTGLPCLSNYQLLEKKIIRSMKYHLEKTGDITQAFEKAKQHIKDKYGRNGYLHLSDTYKKIFSDMLETQYDLIDQL